MSKKEFIFKGTKYADIIRKAKAFQVLHDEKSLPNIFVSGNFETEDGDGLFLRGQYVRLIELSVNMLVVEYNGERVYITDHTSIKGRTKLSY